MAERRWRDSSRGGQQRASSRTCSEHAVRRARPLANGCLTNARCGLGRSRAPGRLAWSEPRCDRPADGGQAQLRNRRALRKARFLLRGVANLGQPQAEPQVPWRSGAAGDRGAVRGGLPAYSRLWASHSHRDGRTRTLAMHLTHVQPERQSLARSARRCAPSCDPRTTIFRCNGSVVLRPGAEGWGDPSGGAAIRAVVARSGCRWRDPSGGGAIRVALTRSERWWRDPTQGRWRDPRGAGAIRSIAANPSPAASPPARARPRPRARS